MKQFLRVVISTALCLLVGAATIFAASYLYVNNYIDDSTEPNTVSGFRVNGDGSLTLLPGFPLPTGGTGWWHSPVEAAAAKIRVGGSYLYVGNGSKDISAFQIHSDGSLTAVPGQPFSTGSEGGSVTLAVHPLGRFLVSGNSDPDYDLSVFSIGADGSLSPVSGSPFVAYTPAFSTAFTPDGRFLFAGGGGPSCTTISAYRFNAATGALSKVDGSPFISGGMAPEAYSVSPDGHQLFSGNLLTYPSTISVFDIDPLTGALSAISASPFDSGLTETADSVLDTPGKRLFVAARQKPANIGVYDIGANGVPTPVAGSPFESGGKWANVVAIDKGGRFLFVANGRSDNVSAFVVSPQTGALTAVSGSPFATGATGGFNGGMVLYEQPELVPAMTSGGLMGFILLLAGSMFVVLRRKSRRA